MASARLMEPVYTCAMTGPADSVASLYTVTALPIKSNISGAAGRHVSGLDVSQLSNIPVALRYESPRCGSC